jgi:hypothetical protein
VQLGLVAVLVGLGRRLSAGLAKSPRIKWFVSVCPLQMLVAVRASMVADISQIPPMCHLNPVKMPQPLTLQPFKGLNKLHKHRLQG